MADITRRAFLKVAAAAGGGAAVGIGLANRAGPRELVSPVADPEQTELGVLSNFATTCRECPAGCGMHVRHIDGRAIKAEGNPEHPINRGRLCARGQASLQGLYDPDRLTAPRRRGATVDWQPAIEGAAERLVSAERVIVVSSLHTGAMAELLAGFAEAFGGPPPMFAEPLDARPEIEANARVFGQAALPDYRIERCDFLLSFAGDFLEAGPSPVEMARRFADMHSLDDAGRIGRFAYVGPRLSMTAANADDFVLVPPGGERIAALAVLREVLLAGRDATGVLRPLADRIDVAPADWGIDAKQIRRLARRFIEADAPLALPGPIGADGPAARETAIAVALLNAAAGAINDTVDFSRPHALGRTTPHADFDAALASLGPDDVLVLHDTNPAYWRPGCVEHLRRAGAVVCLTTLPDETAALAEWALPIDSPLEAWGGYEPRAGVHGLAQPTMQRIHDQTRHAGDVLLAIAQAAGRDFRRPDTDRPAEDFHDWLQQRWSELAGGEPFEQSLRRGGLWREPEASPVRLRDDVSELDFSTIPSRSADGTTLWPWVSPMLGDGRAANCGWLQETPDPTAQAAWGSWLDIHPARARRLGVEDGDVVEVKATAGGASARVPVRVTEDVHRTAVALAMGQGHSAMGRNAAGRGVNAFALAADGPVAVTLRATGEHRPLALASATAEQHGRELLQWANLSRVRRMEPGQGDQFRLPLPVIKPEGGGLYPNHTHPKHRWAMVIDLQRCIGCGACAVACHAENNVPVVGEEELRRGRELSWLKVVPYRKEHDPARAAFLPMLCQHCEDAPCEPVCPTFASVHTEEGLNAQVYNRCVGTRYCANNCPYKVRKFNWFEPDWPTPLNLQLNPDVSARSRGVMEKCTFCVQRIVRGKRDARNAGRDVEDGDITPACGQTCPTGAIIFGDLRDPGSRVSELTRKHPRRYHVLEELNTKPAVTYLRRIKNEEGEPT